MTADFTAHLHDLFAAFGPVSTRRMFGGHGLYHDGVMIGVVFDDALYLKTDVRSQARFEAAGGVPFVYTGQRKPITMSYWSLPEDAMDSPQAMRPWARLAYEAALRKARVTMKPRKCARKAAKK